MPILGSMTTGCAGRTRSHWAMTSPTSRSTALVKPAPVLEAGTSSQQMTSLGRIFIRYQHPCIPLLPANTADTQSAKLIRAHSGEEPHDRHRTNQLQWKVGVAAGVTFVIQMGRQIVLREVEPPPQELCLRVIGNNTLVRGNELANRPRRRKATMRVEEARYPAPFLTVEKRGGREGLAPLFGCYPARYGPLPARHTKNRSHVLGCQFTCPLLWRGHVRVR